MTFQGRINDVWVVVAPDQNVRDGKKMKPYETKIRERELIKRMSICGKLKDVSLLLLKALGESLLYEFSIEGTLKYALL